MGTQMVAVVPPGYHRHRSHLLIDATATSNSIHSFSPLYRSSSSSSSLSLSMSSPRDAPPQKPLPQPPQHGRVSFDLSRNQVFRLPSKKACKRQALLRTLSSASPDSVDVAPRGAPQQHQQQDRPYRSILKSSTNPHWREERQNMCLATTLNLRLQEALAWRNDLKEMLQQQEPYLQQLPSNEDPYHSSTTTTEDEHSELEEHHLEHLEHLEVEHLEHLGEEELVRQRLSTIRLFSDDSEDDGLVEHALLRSLAVQKRMPVDKRVPTARNADSGAESSDMSATESCSETHASTLEASRKKKKNKKTRRPRRHKKH